MLSDADFLEILLELPDWASGLPLSGKVHSGPHYLAPPEQVAEPLGASTPDETALDRAIDSYIDDTRDTQFGPIEHDDAEEFVANLADNVAPLTELVSLPLTPDNKVSCPFHDDPEPSCAIIISIASAAANAAAGSNGCGGNGLAQSASAFACALVDRRGRIQNER